MARHVIVGATGQIGRDVARRLDGAGEQVRALVRDRQRAAAMLPATVELVVGDMRDEQAQRLLLHDADALFVASSDPPSEHAIYEMAGKLRLPLVVKCSAIGFGSDPPRAHAEAEAVLRAQPVTQRVLRPNSFMQTLRAYLPRLVEPDGSFALPAGDGASAWVDTRDIAAVAAELLRRGPEDDGPAVATVTGPDALTMHDVAAAISTATGQAIHYQPSSIEDAERRLAERLGPMGAFLVEHYRAVAAGGFATVSTTVPDLLGRPARSLPELIAEDIDAWASPPPAPAHVVDPE